MSSEPPRRVAELVETVLARVAPALTGGLSAEQAAWTVARFRDTVLPRRLRSGTGTDEDFRRELANVVAEEIVEQFGSLTPQQRWEAAREAWYAERLLPLSDEAFELARAALAGAEPDPQVRSRAAEVRARVAALAAEIDRDAPELAPRLAEVVSEALQDCASVLEDGDLLSLRMGEVLSEPADGDADEPLEGPSCPACEAPVPPGNRFCNACGAPVVCPHCGASLPVAARFCGACGRSVTSAN